MTRVLAVTNLYPPHALGGYEWSCFDVLRRLSERGHDVTVATTTTRLAGVIDDPAEAGHVHRVLEWYWNDHVLTSPPPWRRYAQERRNLARLRSLLRATRPEVVSVWNMGAMSWGLLRLISDAGIPMVFAVCDEWPVYGVHLDAWGRLFEHRRRLGRVVERLLRVPAAPVDLGPSGAWCFVSESTRRACQEGSRLSFEVSTVIHSGIEPTHFPLFDDSQEPEPFEWRLLYVGRLDERKGVLTAIDALAQLPEQATLKLVGRGDAEAAIWERARRVGVAERVEVASVDRSEAAAVYGAADVFLFTSEWTEPFGLTPIEAMACGTPVVGTGTGGSDGFLIHEATCLRVPPGDPAAIAAAVGRIAASPDLRRTLRAGGRHIASQLTTDRLADRFERWHLAAAAGYPDGPPPDRPLLASWVTDP